MTDLPTLAEFRRLRDEFALTDYEARLPQLVTERDRLRAEAAPLWKEYRANKSIAKSNWLDHDAKRVKMQRWEELALIYEALQPIEAQITAIEADMPKVVARLRESEPELELMTT